MKSILLCVLLNTMQFIRFTATVSALTIGAAATADTGKICEFSFEQLTECHYQDASYDISAHLKVAVLDADKLQLHLVQVTNNGAAEKLPLTSETYFHPGEHGYIQITDINFDGVPDLAVTTGFFFDNPQLDYWVYQTESHQYRYVGNYARFTADPTNKTVTTQPPPGEKPQTFVWQDYALVAQP